MSVFVSIILPTYNGSQYITESISSVLAQTYKNFELIIIDDASNDWVKNVIQNFQKLDPRIIYKKNNKNLGISKSLNFWIQSAKGELIARVDDDDMWCDNKKLEKQVEYMQKNPQCGLCGTAIILIDENWLETWRVQNRSSDTEIRQHISQSNQFAHSSIVMRKDILSKIGMYSNDNICLYTEDYDLWLRIGKVANFHNLTDYCLKYRVRSGSITGLQSHKPLYNAFRVFLKHRNDYPHKFKWYISHILTFSLPKNVITKLVRLHKLFD